MKEAYIVSGLRSPVGKAKKGGLRFVRPDDLAATIIKKLVENTEGLDCLLYTSPSPRDS